MSLGERRVLEVLNGHAFHAPECRPSQQLIADQLGCTREYVNRCIRSLSRRGLVTVRKERRNGCKWQHNVYTLTHWSPPMRVRSLRRIRAARALNRTHFSAVHTEGNGNCETEWNGGREVSCVPIPSLSAKRLSSNSADQHKCEGCGALQASLQTIQQQNNQLAEENAALSHQLRRAGMAEMALRRQLEKTLEDEPEAEQIRSIITYWKVKLGHPRAKAPMGGKRAKIVRAALRTHSVTELKQAIDGLALLPYVTDKGRRPTGEPSQRYDDLEYALKDEQRIERFRAYWDRAMRADVWRRYEAWEMVSAVADRYADLLMRAIHEGRGELSADELLDGLPEEERVVAHLRERVMIARSVLLASVGRLGVEA